MGFGVGGGTIPFDLLAEFIPQSERGQFLININYFWTIGSMFVAGCAWSMLTTEGWHLLAIITSIPVAVSLVWAIYVLPESPRWLLVNGKIKEAEDVLRQAAKYNGTELPEFTLKPHGEVLHEGAAISEFFQRKQLPVTIPLWTIWFCFGFCYYGIILLISRLFESSDADDDNEFVCDFQYAEIFISAVSEVGGVVITALLIDRSGRCWTQGILYCIAGITVLFLALKSSNATLTFFSVLARMTSLGSTCATWVATPELFNTHMRATGHSVSSSLARLGAFCVPFLVNSNNTVLTVVIIISAGNFIAMFSSIFLPETKGIYIILYHTSNILLIISILF